MHAVSFLSALALVGSTFAAPLPEPDVVYVTEVAYATVDAPPPGPPRPTPIIYEPITYPQAPAAPTTGGSDYISIVNKWRGKMGLSALAQDSTLESNAQKTCSDGNGQMVHELNPGTMGQVLAPGTSDDFEKVFVGGWLCEVPSTPGLDGICSTYSGGWSYDGQTGHNEILVSPKYTKIGCALAKGIWGCDLA